MDSVFCVNIGLAETPLLYTYTAAETAAYHVFAPRGKRADRVSGLVRKLYP